MQNSISMIGTILCLTIILGCTNRVKDNLSRNNNWTTQHKVDQLIVRISLSPPQASNNTVFISLQNATGEPISDAKITIKSLKQFILTSQKDLVFKPTGVGTYRADTNIGEGCTEMNLKITPKKGPSTNLRINVELDQSSALNLSSVYKSWH